MTIANLYLVGAPKAGTTSLASWLSQHPEVYWSVPKEPYYWAADYPGQRAHYGFDTLARYERLYDSPKARSARYRGDGSTTYLYSSAALPAILDAEPDARFLVCVRDPTQLVISYHRTQLVALNEDEPDFATAWARSLRGELPRTVVPLDPQLVDYPGVGRQGEALTRLLALVPREQVCVVVLEDLVSAPAETLATVFGFLGLDPVDGVELRAENASDKMFRFRLLRRLQHRPPRFLSPVVRWLRQLSRTSPVLRALKRHGWRPSERPQVSPSVRAEVAAHFAADVDLLEEALGRSLPRSVVTGPEGVGPAPAA